MQFYPLKIKEIIRETPLCVAVSFELPDAIANEFIFTAGQYLTLQTQINGENVRRAYSICAAPHENTLQVAVKKVENGVFSSFVNDTLKVGDVLDVMPPKGKFGIDIHAEKAQNYVFFAAGSGITPIISIIKQILNTEPHSQISLIYGNKNFEHIIFREKIEALKNKYINRLSVWHVLSRDAQGGKFFSGRIDKEKAEFLCTKLINTHKTDAYFLCGPQTMIFDIKDALLAQGVEKSKIHFELFGSAPKAAAAPKIMDKNTQDTAQKARIDIIMDGYTTTFDLQYNAENILDAAMLQGADLPYACKAGVCCTCRAKVTEGSVDMLLNYALEPQEIADGFVLSCQAIPTSAHVVLDFDAK